MGRKPVLANVVRVIIDGFGEFLKIKTTEHTSSSSSFIDDDHNFTSSPLVVSFFSQKWRTHADLVFICALLVRRR